jgi:hypothetical protein
MIILAVLIMTAFTITVGLAMHGTLRGLSDAISIVDGATVIGVFLGWLLGKFLKSRLKSYLQVENIQKALNQDEQNNLKKEMRTEYELNSGDESAFKIYNFENSPKTGLGWKLLQRAAIVASGVYLVLAVVSYVILGKEFLPLAVIFVVLALLTLAWFVIAPFRIIRNSKHTVFKNYNQTNKLTGKHKLFITSEAMTDMGDNGEKTIRWSAIKYVLSSDHYIFILGYGSDYHIIPRRAFSDEASFNDFANLAKTFHKASQITRNTG